MNNVTQFEHLSNDLLLEIFDYFHALDLFMAFSSLNQRISSVLSSAELHVIITKIHCQHQMKILSSHLTHHAHQVISLSLEDQLRDYSSVICFFFDQHIFTNLRSCRFYNIHLSSNFQNVIQGLESLTNLISFYIFHPDKKLPYPFPQDITKTMLTHRSLALRFIGLSLWHDYQNLAANIAINWSVTSLMMSFGGSVNSLSIYSFLPILRHFRALRVLRTYITNETDLNNQQFVLPTPYENNPPIAPSIRTFELTIEAICSFHSLDFILHCMPNLRQFIVVVIYRSSVPLTWRNLFDGYQWQQILTNNTPYLDTFNISIWVEDINLIPDVNTTLKSFDYFTNKYKDWYVAIERPFLYQNHQKSQICLHGFRRFKKVRFCRLSEAKLTLGTPDSPISTNVDFQPNLFYSNIKNLRINIPAQRIVLNTQSTEHLFRKVRSLTIERQSPTLSTSQRICGLFNSCVSVTEIDQGGLDDEIVNLVDLRKVKKLEIQSTDDTSRLYFLPKILIASSRLIHLKISNRLIFSPILYDNASLTYVFHQLQSLYLLTDPTGFPMIYASKIIDRFPSIIHLELEINSLHLCKPLIVILLNGLPKLTHLKIHFQTNKFQNDLSCLLDYFISQRHQAFPNHPCRKEEASINIDGNILNIYFTGCSICAYQQY